MFYFNYLNTIKRKFAFIFLKLLSHFPCCSVFSPVLGLSGLCAHDSDDTNLHSSFLPTWLHVTTTLHLLPNAILIMAF
jgi:hypothetical protein